MTTVADRPPYVASQAYRDQLVRQAIGFYAETTPWSAATGAVIPTLQSVYGMMIGMCANDVVTGFAVEVNVAGSGVTLFKTALYSKTGTLLVATPDWSATINGGTGTKNQDATLTAGQKYVVPTDDVYFAALLAVGGTGPTLMQSRGAIAAFQGVGSGIGPCQTQGSQSDLPSPATLTASAGSRCFWIGIY